MATTGQYLLSARVMPGRYGKGKPGESKAAARRVCPADSIPILDKPVRPVLDSRAPILMTMKLIVLYVVLTVGVVAGADQPGQGDNKSRKTQAGADAKAKLSPEELETKFKATLTKATLSGRWCAIQNGKL